MEPVIPSVITPEQAADALGLTVHELAENISGAVQGRLHKLASAVRDFTLDDLDDFDEALAEARRLYVSLRACWAAIDAAVEEVEG